MRPANGDDVRQLRAEEEEAALVEWFPRHCEGAKHCLEPHCSAHDDWSPVEHYGVAQRRSLKEAAPMLAHTRVVDREHDLYQTQQTSRVTAVSAGLRDPVQLEC